MPSLFFSFFNDAIRNLYHGNIGFVNNYKDKYQTFLHNFYDNFYNFKIYIINKHKTVIDINQFTNL